MATIKWSDDQLKIINTRDKNILVSAAAGSGKTAVLVARIISLIESGIDVDNILIVTFTKAAAAEMKERVLRTLEEKKAINPSNPIYYRQESLLHNAQITTIDSFCGYVVKNYFYEIGLDPDYRIISQGELSVLQKRVFKDLLNDRLESPSEDFLKLCRIYVSKGNDRALMEAVYQLCAEAESMARPHNWFDKVYENITVDSVEDFEHSALIEGVFNDFKTNIVPDILSSYETMMEALSNGAPEAYINALEGEVNEAQELINCNTFDECVRCLSQIEFPRFPTSKWPSEDKTVAKAARDSAKEIIVEYKQKFFSQPIKDEYLRYSEYLSVLRELVIFSKDFYDAVMEEKTARASFTFSDIEHFALNILRNPDNTVTDTAKELSRNFYEVMVDEYQDSNELQELILTAVCGGNKGRNNYFTVGDVKQSIYGFRNADPSLFISKFESYAAPDNQTDIRIDLKENYRSRDEVLQFSNDIFQEIMHKNIGNVEYDSNARLYLGNKDYPVVNENMNSPEILICDGDLEHEIMMVGNRIRELVKNQLVTKNKALKPCSYKDIVILLSTVSGVGDKYVEILRRMDIPSYIASEKGYFDALEINTILSMLRAIDNPLNDISVAAVLRSALFNMSDDELALIRNTNKEDYFYQALLDYAANTDSKIAKEFIDYLSECRLYATDHLVHELLIKIIADRHFYSHLRFEDMGETLVANVEKLVNEAVKFESGTYKGLYNFIKYIDSLIEGEEDLGLAKLYNENDNVVTIMSIHKSKGLEFPIVILGNTDKTFNEMDLNNDILTDKDYIASNIYSIDEMTKYNGLYRTIIRKNKKRELLGEELRVLYVALTRASEKVIISGKIKHSDKEDSNQKADKKAKSSVGKASSFLDLILIGLKNKSYPIILEDEDEIDKRVVLATINEYADIKLIYELSNKVDKDEIQAIKDKLSYEYSSQEVGLKSKYSVSEIKHDAMDKLDSYQSQAAPALDIEPYTTGNSKPEVNKGAMRGTAMHRFMECVDFAADRSTHNYDIQIKHIIDKKSMNLEEIELLNKKQLEGFLNSELMDRMHEAAKLNNLYLEQPFVKMCSAKELWDDTDVDKDDILVQGIIDAFFIEDNEIVLLDYKTDNLDNSIDFVRRYHKQLQLYKDALSAAFNMPVKSMLIYSFKLGEIIDLDGDYT